MPAKSLILLVIALGCGMIAAVAVSKTVMTSEAAPVQEATVEIFVAVSDISSTQQITAKSVKLEKWPKNRLPEGALTKLEQVEGKFANQMIFANEPILQKKVIEQRDSFATTIPPGYRVFDIECTLGYIKPGDHVDINGTFKLGGRNAPPETKTVMRNVTVCGINGITTRDSEALKGGKGTVFQLLIKDSQLEALTTAKSLGTLQLNLRPMSEGLDSEDLDNGDQFLTWLSEKETPEPEVSVERTQQVFATIENMFAPAAEAPLKKETKEMLFITPNGVVKYEWSDDKELPRIVEEPKSAPTQPNLAGGAGNPWETSGNVYSGYGGYSPTYPTSTGPQQTQPGQAPTEGPEEQSKVN
jgi:pilus assembly protein CpaB